MYFHCSKKKIVNTYQLGPYSQELRRIHTLKSSWGGGVFIFRKLGSDVYNGDELTWDVSLYKAGNRGDRVKLCHTSSSLKTTWFLHESRWPFFFFLSLNHVVIACYLHLTLQIIEEMLQDWWSWPVLTPKRKRSRSNLISLELLLTNSWNLKVYLDVLNLIFSFNLYLHRGKNKSPAPIKAIPTQRSYNQKLLQPGQRGGSRERRVGG